MPIFFIPEIADAITLGTLGGAIGGSIGGWCADNPDASGCVQKRDILNTKSVPRMRIERQDVGPCNVPQYNFDQCHDQLANSQVTSSLPSAGEAMFVGVPAACMDLATVLTGSCGADGPQVIVCGSDCLNYSDLSDEDLATLSNTLRGK
ncbi:hypothetical protein F5Y18DRAFT_32003 [Xylariaceae sp. FL1019]|nr:hypothetical protein F5Y18DRAFT_32003 [Xylariaceae sp. FL1019]